MEGGRRVLTEELAKTPGKGGGRDDVVVCVGGKGNGGDRKRRSQRQRETIYVQGNFGTVTFPTLITVNHWEQTLHTASSVNRIIKL